MAGVYREGEGIVSTYLTAAESAAYLKTTYKGFDHFVRRYGVPCVRRGRIRLFSQDTLDRVLRTMALRPVRRPA